MVNRFQLALNGIFASQSDRRAHWKAHTEMWLSDEERSCAECQKESCLLLEAKEKELPFVLNECSPFRPLYEHLIVV